MDSTEGCRPERAMHATEIESYDTIVQDKLYSLYRVCKCGVESRELHVVMKRGDGSEKKFRVRVE